MKNTILSLAMAGLCCAQSVALAQQYGAAPAATPHATPVGLTLKTALERALQRHPEVRAAANEAAATAGAVQQAGTRANPELELLREGSSQPDRSTTVQFNIPLELGGKRAARVRAAQSEQRVAAIEVDAARARIRSETIAAFYELLAAKERVHLAGEMMALAAKASETAGKRVIAGKVSPVEETRAKVAQAGVRIDAVQAKREHARARLRLAALTGDDASRIDVANTATMQPPAIADLPALLARLEQAPSMARARAVVAHREALVDVERTRRTPDVTVALGSKREDGRRQTVVGLSVPLPLFNRNQGSLLESLRRADKARDELEAAAVRLRSELAEAHLRLTSSSEELRLIAEEVLPGAESTYQAASRGFELGKFSFLEVLDAQRTLIQSRNQYLQALAERYQASAEIDRIVGPAMPYAQTQEQE
jgi:cobalt-zinc-cadmium efflux system outer membrane protein